MKGASKEGEPIELGQEPELAPGVRGVLFDKPEGIYIPSIVAEKPGSGKVGVYLDSLPTDRRVVVIAPFTPQLTNMLRDRGFVQGLEYSQEHHCNVAIMVRGASHPGEQLYYLLDCRQVVGNCALWWRPNGGGYTCNLSEAGLYTKQEAFGHRETDIPIAREVAESCAISHVRQSDMRDWAEKTLGQETGKKWCRKGKRNA